MGSIIFIGSPAFIAVYGQCIEWLKQHMLECPSRKWLHVQCPGCGFQRSFIALLDGRLQKSFLLYPALIPFLVLMVFVILHLKFRFRQGHAVIKYSYVFVACIVAVSYIYKVFNHQITT